uniref:Uncharacterized protein n=1 Tax=Caenorhabditis tropicalis TaxID=1561998 RepID=A0A1I7TEA6_9PELO
MSSSSSRCDGGAMTPLSTVQAAQPLPAQPLPAAREDPREENEALTRRVNELRRARLLQEAINEEKKLVMAQNEAIIIAPKHARLQQEATEVIREAARQVPRGPTTAEAVQWDATHHPTSPVIRRPAHQGPPQNFVPNPPTTVIPDPAPIFPPPVKPEQVSPSPTHPPSPCPHLPQ